MTPRASGEPPSERPCAPRRAPRRAGRQQDHAPDDPGAPARRRGRRPRDIGTAAETAVVRYLREHGWPHAERRALAGSADRGDITGCVGLVWEVKGGSAAKLAGPKDIDRWLDETEAERRNAQADVGILVKARAGYGPARVGQWWAIIPLSIVLGSPAPELTREQVWMTLDHMTRWLRWTGYGERLRD